MNGGNVPDIPLDEQHPCRRLRDMPCLDPGVLAPDPEDRGALAFGQLLIMLDILLVYSLPELFVAFEKFVDHKHPLYRHPFFQACALKLVLESQIN